MHRIHMLPIHMSRISSPHPKKSQEDVASNILPLTMGDHAYYRLRSR